MRKYKTQSFCMSMQFSKPEYKKGRCEFCEKLLNIEAARAFLGKKSKELTRLLQEDFPEIRKASFKLSSWRGDLEYKFEMSSEKKYDQDTLHMIKEVIEKFQKSMAKEFNAQPFSKTEFGHAKFPSRNPNGIQLYDL